MDRVLFPLGLVSGPRDVPPPHSLVISAAITILAAWRSPQSRRWSCFVRAVVTSVGATRFHSIHGTVQPGVTQRKPPEHGILQTCLLKSLYQFFLRVAFGMPPLLYENFCFWGLPCDQYQDAAARSHARVQSGEDAWQILLGKILEHRSRQDEVVICPRGG